MLRNVITVGALLLASCGAERSGGPASRVSPKPTDTFTPAAATQATSPPLNREGCPAQSAGARVAAEKVEGGAALVFTTPEDIAAFRAGVSGMAMPIAMQKTERRLDNIHEGVRLIFETSDSKDVASLREAVGENARRIAQKCGLALASPPDPKPAPEPSKSPPKPPSKSPDDSKSKESDAERAKKDASKTEPSPKPKDEPKDKPKDAEKPKQPEKAPPPPEKPKEDDKPPPPPDAPPPPILPRP